jgi:DNA-binding SARP family transcriptional activator
VESKRSEISFPTTAGVGSSSVLVGDPPAVVIRVLGPFAIEAADAVHDEKLWNRVHARRLVQMVASNAKLQEPRTKVLQTLWPDFDDTHARNRLHHTVHLVRKGLEVIPAAVRPVLTVDALCVSLTLPPKAVVDAQQFMLALDAPANDDATRLGNIERALWWYHGELAADWADTSSMVSRRAWLARLHEDAMNEAVSLSLELERFEQALKFAQFRAQLLAFDVDAQCEYAALLAQLGRADVALEHCHAARLALAREGDAASPKFEAVERSIQRQVNQASSSVEAGPPAPRKPQGLGRGILPSRKPLLGYETVLSATLLRLRDPHTSMVSLVGPPGAGKSALALEIAHRCQPDFLHGVLWVDCRGVNDQTDTLMSRLESALSTDVRYTDEAGRLSRINRALQSKEVLVILDGLEFGSRLSVSLTALLAINRDVRWLATAWSSFNVAYEKTVLMDAADLLQSRAESDSSVTPAVLLLSCAGSQPLDLNNKCGRSCVDNICKMTGGLPSLLLAASSALESALPSELNAKLLREPTALLRVCSADGDPRVNDLVRWLSAATMPMQRLLSIASRCKSWLRRLDLALLLDSDGLSNVDALVDQCASMHWLQRRVNHDHGGSWSEFKVPAFALAALTFCEGAVSQDEAQMHVERWLNCGALAATGAVVHQTYTDSKWFDDRIEDYQATVDRWFAEGRRDEVAALCRVHMRSWVGARHKGEVLRWLTQLGERMDCIDNGVAAHLLLERARLREDSGNIHGAFDDANRALTRVTGSSNPTVRAEAARLTERYGKTTHDVDARSPVVRLRGVEAGESLMRVAKLTAKQGEPQRALKLCSEAAVVFNYFGLGRGVLKANQYRARIAYAMGDTELAMRCIAQCERTARSIGEWHEVAIADLMSANVLLADLKFGQAIDLSASVLARPEIANNPSLLTRGLLALGWSYYAAGAFSVIRVMSHGLLEQARLSAEPGARINARLLTMLADARSGHRQRAFEQIGPMLGLLEGHSALPDVQGELMNVTELVVHLDHAGLAKPMVQALDNFDGRPDHQLRPWTCTRLGDLRGILERQPLAANAAMFASSQDPPSLGRVLQFLMRA